MLRYEGDLGGEILGRRHAHGAGNEANLPRDENAFVYLYLDSIIGLSTAGMAALHDTPTYNDCLRVRADICWCPVAQPLHV